MRMFATMGVLLLGCATVPAQNTQWKPTAQSSGMSQMNMESNQQTQGMSGMHQHMQQMQTEMQQMKSQIEKMRADAEKVQDSNTKAALLDNANTWDQFLNHMQSHMSSMKNMHQGMTGMHNKPKRSSTGQAPASNPQ